MAAADVIALDLDPDLPLVVVVALVLAHLLLPVVAALGPALLVLDLLLLVVTTPATVIND